MKLMACLLGSALAVGPATVASAQVDVAAPETNERSTDAEIVITANRVPTAVSEVPTSITVIGEEAVQLQTRISRDIFDTLQVLVPGIGANQEIGSSCNVKLRGRTASFLVNGVPLGQDLRPSSCNDLSTVSQFAVERIEVNRGATAVYGFGAPGGVINVLTRRARKDLEVDAVANFSANPRKFGRSTGFDGYVGVGQRKGDFDYYIGGAFSDLNARYDPDGNPVSAVETQQQFTVNGSAALQVGLGEVRITANYHHENPDDRYGSTFDASRALRIFPSRVEKLDRHPDRDAAYRNTWLVTGSFDHPDVLGSAFNLTIYAGDQREKNRENFGDIGDPFFLSNTLKNSRVGARTTFATPLKKLFGDQDGQLIWGTDYVTNRFYRPQFDVETGSELIGFISPEVELETYAFFGQLRVPFGKLILSGGVRYEKFSGKIGDEGFVAGLPGAGTPGDIPDFSSTIFNAGIVYQIADSFEIYTGFSQGTEVSQLGSAARGIEDPASLNLQPAKSDQYEIGSRFRSTGFRLEGAVYYSSSKLASRLVPEPSCANSGGLCLFIPLRQPERIWGVELSGEVDLTAALKLGSVFTYQDGETEDPDTGVEKSIIYSIITPPRLTTYLDFNQGGWSARLQGVYFFPTDAFDGSTEFLEGDTSSLLVLDASVARELGPGRLTIGISNLLDKTYVQIPQQSFNSDGNWTPSEGLRATIGYSVRF